MSVSQIAEDRRPPTPWIVALLTGAIVLTYVAFVLAPASLQEQLDYAFAIIPERFDPQSPEHFNNWLEALGPTFGHTFLHAAWWHAGLNAFFLFATGRFAALRLGWWRFLLVYLASALGGTIAFVALNWNEASIAIGASDAVCGVFMAYFLSVRADWRQSLAIPMVRNQLGMIILLNVVLMAVLSELNIFPIAWEGHMGGFVGGFIAYVLLQPRYGSPASSQA
jgi:membrane associated rhomboid family serine protease